MKSRVLLCFPPPLTWFAELVSSHCSHLAFQLLSLSLSLPLSPVHRFLLISDSYFHLNADDRGDKCKLESQTYSAFLPFPVISIRRVLVEKRNHKCCCLRLRLSFAPVDCHEFKEGLKLHWPALKSTILILKYCPGHQSRHRSQWQWKWKTRSGCSFSEGPRKEKHSLFKQQLHSPLYFYFKHSNLARL